MHNSSLVFDFISFSYLIFLKEGAGSMDFEISTKFCQQGAPNTAAESILKWQSQGKCQ